mmetsp:Transcript_41791/g.132131  ORF Transcript_41791/g.132131 Transcript_41791/m.132131 type:complete len:566 (-) Transcript_41791:21-1718(-)
MQAKTNGRMFIIVLVCFGITYGLNKLQDFLRDKKDSNSSSGYSTAMTFTSIVPSLGIAATNIGLCLTAKREAKKEYHDTFTDEEFSQALKMTIGMIVNTAGVTYFCNAKPADWYKSGGLVEDLVFVIIFQCLLAPFVSYLDLGWRLKGLQRRKLTDEKLQAFNANLALGPPKSKEQAEERKRVLADIAFFKKAYRPSAINNPRRYATALKNFIVCLLYTPLLPWLSLVGALGLAVQYCLDKYLLVRWMSRPDRPANSNMSMFALRAVKYVAPLGLAVSAFVFLSPSSQDKTAMWSNFYLSAIFALVVSFLMPYSVWSKICLPCFASLNDDVIEEDYYQAQFMWPKEMKYHKDQFIYKKLPDSVNPEYLSAGVDSTVKADAAVATYGLAAEQAGADAGHAPLHSTRLPGGRVVGGAPAPDESPLSAAEAGVAWSPYGPSTAIAPSVYRAEEVEAPSYPPGPPLPPMPPPVSPTPPGASGGSGGSGPPGASAPQIWEFKVRAGWEAFEGGAQRDLQQRYAEFLAGGESRVTVKNGPHSISIFFDKMSSKLADGHDRIRPIRNSRDQE